MRWSGKVPVHPLPQTYQNLSALILSCRQPLSPPITDGRPRNCNGHRLLRQSDFSPVSSAYANAPEPFRSGSCFQVHRERSWLNLRIRRKLTVFRNSPKTPVKWPVSIVARGGNQFPSGSRLLEQGEQKRGRRGRFRGRPQPGGGSGSGAFPASGKGGGGKTAPSKTLANVGLLRAFVGPTRRQKPAPAGSFPRRALFSQSDLGVCETGGEGGIRTPGTG